MVVRGLGGREEGLKLEGRGLRQRGVATGRGVGRLAGRLVDGVVGLMGAAGSAGVEGGGGEVELADVLAADAIGIGEASGERG